MRKNHNLMSWIAVLLVMSVIFFLSSQPAPRSNELSKQVTEVIVKIAKKVMDSGADTEELVERFNSLVRKYAHGGVYFVLGFFTAMALVFSGMGGLGAFFLSMSICVFYAVIDEMHQHFIPGRGAQMEDILIDSAGAFSGILLFLFLAAFRKMMKN